jgi:rare lipoprotein A
MPAFSFFFRRALCWAALSIAASAPLLTVTATSAHAALDDEDTEYVADQTDRAWVFADDPAFVDEETDRGWSPPTYESAGEWLSYARGYVPSSYTGSPGTPSTGSTTTGANDPAPGAREQSGDASWYSTTPGACAHRTVPEGSTITVTNTRNGKSTTCTVEGWGPEDRSRVIDLSEETFAAIADPDVGVIPVHLSW